MTVQGLVRRFHCPVVSCTVNVAGAVKDSLLIRRCFSILVSRLQTFFSESDVLYREVRFLPTGPECFFAVRGDAKEIKRCCIEAESSSPAGRLFDADVFAEDGSAISRTALQFSERGCIVCGAPGRNCSRSMAHPLSEVIEKMKALADLEVTTYDAQFPAVEKLAALAVNALLREVHVTPKPGLVDEANSGSHDDMDLPLMEKSAESLRSYFETAVRIGIETAGLQSEDTFPLLRAAGQDVEETMFRVTNGVNTHKGAIYLFGILLGAAGRLLKSGRFSGNDVSEPEIRLIESILDESRRIAERSVREDLERIPELPEEYREGSAANEQTADAVLISRIKKETGLTAGEIIYRLYGLSGVRGEVSEGFPSVRTALRPLLSGSVTPEQFLSNDSLVRTLLQFIAEGKDTNMISRGGFEGAKKAAETVRSLLETDCPDLKAVIHLDREFIAAHLSPGGSADLLAVTVFLATLRTL